MDGKKIPVPPTHKLDKATVPDHEYSLDNRPGQQAPDFDLEEVDMKFLAKSQAFLERHVKENPTSLSFCFTRPKPFTCHRFLVDRSKAKPSRGHMEILFSSWTTSLASC